MVNIVDNSLIQALAVALIVIGANYRTYALLRRLGKQREAHGKEVLRRLTLIEEKLGIDDRKETN